MSVDTPLQSGGPDPQFSILQFTDVWDELILNAKRLLAKESCAHSQGPSDVVMTVVRRLNPNGKHAWEDLVWNDKDEFMRVFYTFMRWALRDKAMKRKAGRRPQLVSFDPASLILSNVPAIVQSKPDLVIALGDALEILDREDPDLVRTINCRYFIGLTVEETIDAFRNSEWNQSISASTVKRQTATALKRLLEILASLKDETH